MVVALLISVLLLACESGSPFSEAGSPSELQVDAELDEAAGEIVVRNRSGETVHLASSIGMEVRREGDWTSATPLLEEISGTVFADTLAIRELPDGDTHRFPVPLYESLPAGSYRATVAYAKSARDGLDHTARVEFDVR